MPRSRAISSPARIGAIADHDRDLRIQLAARDAVGDGFEVRAAARKSECPAALSYRYSTRPLPRRCAIISPITQGFSPARFKRAQRPYQPSPSGPRRSCPTPRLNVRRQSSSGTVADLAQHLEQRRNLPGSGVDRGRQSFRQHARQIIRDAAAGDMRRAGSASAFISA